MKEFATVGSNFFFRTSVQTGNQTGSSKLCLPCKKCGKSPTCPVQVSLISLHISYLCGKRWFGSACALAHFEQQRMHSIRCTTLRRKAVGQQVTLSTDVSRMSVSSKKPFGRQFFHRCDKWSKVVCTNYDLARQWDFVAKRPKLYPTRVIKVVSCDY